MTIEAGGKKKELEVEKVLVAAGRAPNIEDIGLKEARRPAHRARLHQDQRRDGDVGERHLRHRRRRRSADARAQGSARGRRARRVARGDSTRIS